MPPVWGPAYRFFMPPFSYKVKVEACEPGSVKQKKLMDLGVNYL